jgi:hypothetical protein
MLSLLKNHPEVEIVCGNRFSGRIDDKAFYGSFSIGYRVLALAIGYLTVFFLAAANKFEGGLS